jgi:hypothetical protein
MNANEIALKAVNEWFAYQNVIELENALVAVDLIKPQIVMELGTAHGGSLAAWAEICKPQLTISLDPEDIPRTPEQQASFDNLCKQYKFERIQFYDRNPHAHELLKIILAGRKIDFMFLDGAHGFDDVNYDFYSYKKYMSPNGVVGFHDIYGCEALEDAGSGVNWLWDRLIKRYSYDLFYSHSGMGIGLIYLGRPQTPSAHKQ